MITFLLALNILQTFCIARSLLERTPRFEKTKITIDKHQQQHASTDKANETMNGYVSASIPAAILPRG